MKYQIRNNTFETNSSSAHSFTLGENPELLVTDPQVELCEHFDKETETLIVHGDGFGWGPDTLDSWQRRLDYIATQFDRRYDKMELLEKSFEYFTGYKMKFEDPHGGSYIDHESEGILDELNTKEQIINFVFNKGTTVFIDNDNSPYYWCDEEEFS